MLIILLGYETPSRHEDPKVLYAGHCGVKAQEVIASSDMPRIERHDGPQGRTVRAYSEAAAEKYKAARTASGKPGKK